MCRTEDFGYFAFSPSLSKMYGGNVWKKCIGNEDNNSQENVWTRWSRFSRTFWGKHERTRTHFMTVSALMNQEKKVQ